MKNNDKNIVEKIQIEPNFNLIKILNNTTEPQNYTHEVDNNYIQMYFGLDGDAKLFFNQGKYTIDIQEHKSLILFNPNQNLPINSEILPKSKIILILITIKKFHSFFIEFAKHITFLSEENSQKKYYSAKDLTPSEDIVLNQIFSNKLHKSLEILYLKGKIFELLSLYFNFNENDDDEKCPFLEDEDNVEKIKQAKEIIIDRMANPPSLNELASEIGLSLKKLKDGFKHIYGETVYNFLINYKLDYARKLIEMKKHNVSEISDIIGYSTSSHFIAAFKKKFGTTPKKYLGKI
ncbi:MAG TPA: AraC family transcriptional regulator [Flavobacteriia bacterium]|nr:AraC family transcriptional regulator [Flavobacteriia bacterium]